VQAVLRAQAPDELPRAPLLVAGEVQIAKRSVSGGELHQRLRLDRDRAVALACREQLAQRFESVVEGAVAVQQVARGHVERPHHGRRAPPPPRQREDVLGLLAGPAVQWLERQRVVVLVALRACDGDGLRVVFKQAAGVDGACGDDFEAVAQQRQPRPRQIAPLAEQIEATLDERLPRRSARPAVLERTRDTREERGGRDRTGAACGKGREGGLDGRSRVVEEQGLGLGDGERAEDVRPLRERSVGGEIGGHPQEPSGPLRREGGGGLLGRRATMRDPRLGTWERPGSVVLVGELGGPVRPPTAWHGLERVRDRAMQARAAVGIEFVGERVAHDRVSEVVPRAPLARRPDQPGTEQLVDRVEQSRLREAGQRREERELEAAAEGAGDPQHPPGCG
jgi:hypothetical protein